MIVLIKALLHKFTDAKLIEENAYLQDEVNRLRAQVALHINPCRPAAYPTSQRIAA